MKQIKVMLTVSEEREAQECPHCEYVFTVDAFSECTPGVMGEVKYFRFKDQCVDYCPACGKESARRDVEGKRIQKGGV